MTCNRIIVAIVDDDAGVLRALSRLVRSLGYEPVAFHSGEALLDAVDAQTPAFAILDQHLPGQTGLDTLSKLAQSIPPIPAAIITGLDEPGLRARCLAAGAVAYILKPVSQVEVDAAIRGATCRTE
jgi:FixJ family two-component response regulator